MHSFSIKLTSEGSEKQDTSDSNPEKFQTFISEQNKGPILQKLTLMTSEGKKS